MIVYGPSDIIPTETASKICQFFGLREVLNDVPWDDARHAEGDSLCIVHDTECPPDLYATPIETILAIMAGKHLHIKDVKPAGVVRIYDVNSDSFVPITQDAADYMSETLQSAGKFIREARDATTLVDMARSSYKPDRFFVAQAAIEMHEKIKMYLSMLDEERRKIASKYGKAYHVSPPGSLGL